MKGSGRRSENRERLNVRCGLPGVLFATLCGVLRSVVVMKRTVCWMSSGVSSFIAGYLVKEEVTDWFYIDVADQHPDSIRFIRDCEKVIGQEVKILRSDKYKDVADVIRRTGCTNTPFGAPCTGMLKKAVRKKWENEHLEDDITYIWGMDAKEKKRADSIVQNFPEFHHRFPLIEKMLSKDDCHAILTSLGIKRPLMYDMGYQNNNCVGCVKGGMAYWNKIRKDFPDVFASRAALEREVGHSCINGVFLDELDPEAGRDQPEIMGDCSIMCYLVQDELKQAG